MFDLLKKTFKRQKHTTTYYHGRFHDFRQNFYPNVVPENSKTQLPERGRRWTGLTQDLLKSPMLVCTSIVVPTSVFEEKKGSTKEPTLQGTNISHLRKKKNIIFKSALPGDMLVPDSSLPELVSFEDCFLICLGWYSCVIPFFRSYEKLEAKNSGQQLAPNECR